LIISFNLSFDVPFWAAISPCFFRRAGQAYGYLEDIKNTDELDKPKNEENESNDPVHRLRESMKTLGDHIAQVDVEPEEEKGANSSAQGKNEEGEKIVAKPVVGFKQ
jgi:hypothetical protein